MARRFMSTEEALMEVEMYNFSELENDEMDLSILNDLDSDRMDTDIESSKSSDEESDNFDGTGWTVEEQATLTFHIILL